MTQVEIARAGRVSPEMARVARDESVEPDKLRAAIARGTVVIPKNRRRRVRRLRGIGAGLRTKINANIGTSKGSSSLSRELAKMRVAIEYGADAIMDLSTGGNIRATRRAILAKSDIAVGTVPVYQMFVEGVKKFGSIAKVPADYMFDVLEEQAVDGVDFVTIHAGVTSSALAILRDNPRILDIVSRGGALLAEWIIANGRENPFFEQYDRVIDIALRYDMTLSLGDGLRPGAGADATDIAQLAELVTLGDLQKRALKAGAQVIIEGPGHVPIDQIEANVRLEKSICHGAPFYVLGPLVTDAAPGYDHITGAIGGAIAASAGADFLCYVTPSEHLRLPTVDDVREGVMASRIAAHAADIVKGVKGASERDRAISAARARRDWKRQFALALDSIKPRRYRTTSHPGAADVCTMCSDYCSIRVAEKCFKRIRG